MTLHTDVDVNADVMCKQTLILQFVFVSKSANYKEGQEYIALYAMNPRFTEAFNSLRVGITAVAVAVAV